MADVDLAFATARRQPDLVILLGIEPDSPDEEYGWIEPERKFSKDVTSDLYRVRRFWEKPSSAGAATNGVRLPVEQFCDGGNSVRFSEDDPALDERAFHEICRRETGDVQYVREKRDRGPVRRDLLFRFFK